MIFEQTLSILKFAELSSLAPDRVRVPLPAAAVRAMAQRAKFLEERLALPDLLAVACMDQVFCEKGRPEDEAADRNAHDVMLSGA